jgi:tricorn protease-like protein
MNSKTGIAITSNKEFKGQDVIALVTYDGGLTWDKYIELPNMASPLFCRDSLWYLSEDKGKYTLNGINIYNKQFKTETLPLGFYPEKLEVGSTDDFWLVGKQNNKMTLYKRNIKEEYIKVKEFDDDRLFYSYVNVYKDQITLIAGRIVSLIVVYKFFISTDFGKTWSAEEPPGAVYMKPVASFQDKLWIYSGAGEIQIRE